MLKREKRITPTPHSLHPPHIPYRQKKNIPSQHVLVDDRAKCEALKAQIATDGIETFGEVAKEHSSCALFAPHPHPPPPQKKLAQPPANTKPPNRCRRRIGRPAATRASLHCPSDTPIPPTCHTHSSHMSRPTPRKCRIRFVSDHLSMYIVQIRNEYEQACARSRHYILERLVAPRLSPPLQAPAQRREGSSARSVRARWCQSLKRSPSVKSSARCMAQWRQSSGTIWYSSISGRRSEMIRR